MRATAGTADLARTTVRDVMESDIISVSPDMPVANLVELLEEERISGVPVVDSDEVCLGVVSVSDVSRAALREARDAPTEASTRESPGSTGSETAEAGAFFRVTDRTLGAGPPAELPEGLPRTRLGARPVREIMTPATFSVRSDATLPALARFLVRTGVHRALVFENRRLAGLVTAVDVLRAVAELDRDD